MITYTFDDFSYVDRPIMIPKETVFYRGISKGKTIDNLQILRPDVPIYIASKHVDDAYT